MTEQTSPLFSTTVIEEDYDYKKYGFKDEKELQNSFVKKLRENGWYTQEYPSCVNNKKIDVIAINKKYDIIIGFELKYPTKINDYTKALRQLIYYSKQKWEHQPDIYALITPIPLNEIYQYGSIFITRFFWRWGFGVGSYKSQSIVFVNGHRNDIIWLDGSYNHYSSISPKEHAKKIITRMKKYRKEDAY